MEKHFSLQADLALAKNKAAALAYEEGDLPLLYRLDHDMADSRGTLVNVKTLDKIWLPHFTRCIEPLVKAGVKLIWHCDGNLMELIPRLLEAGIKGFQGFQYEDNMDYEKICSMKTRDGEDLLIWAGVSVTRTLPFGKPKDVKRELEWLVEKGPKTGLFLGVSSSMIPGVSWENVETLIEGLKYYQNNGGLNSDTADIRYGKTTVSICSTTASGESIMIPSHTMFSAPVVAPRSLFSKPWSSIVNGLVGMYWSIKSTPMVF
jgi:hypothetical protein